MKWNVKVEMVAEFYQREEIKITVEADTEEEAIEAAKKQARDEFSPDRWEAEHDHSYTDSVEIECCEPGFIPPFRCNLTPDMFSGVAA